MIDIQEPFQTGESETVEFKEAVYPRSGTSPGMAAMRELLLLLRSARMECTGRPGVFGSTIAPTAPGAPRRMR